jgi:3'(2'), 5'-bisphosphate nucleotidase
VANDIGRVLAAMASEAAELIRPLWRSGVEVVRKADASPVTEADQRAEALILERLGRDFPGVTVVGEEGCADEGTPETIPDRFFLVDPLDGTRGFISGSTEFTVNIALIEHGFPAAGAVATPADGRVWFTEGGRARLREGGSEREIRVRPRPEEAVALVSNSMGGAAADRLGAIHGFSRWRAVNSSLKLVLIASGEADLYPRDGPTSEWDIAAGQAVLEAAGGRVVARDGRRLRYGKAEARFLNPPFTASGG